ncbi:MAG TPA: tripartite tricarboxylate transporter substrate binding protein [Falsiroseomonas sp.]|jgi:tripartite-type tricarboxylate transporter receptor subunit TctC|nr:tripartite tricarboxylate transporter substrate binding protein [Falsiroseomonas sp.]
MSRLPRRGLIAAAIAVPTLVRAQAFPTRPLRLVVPFAPGGSTDIIARILAARLGPLLGGTVLVENRPGAGGNIGIEAVVRSAPDGYTLVLGAPGGLTVNPLLYRNLTYQPLRDLAPVAMVADSELVIAVARNVPAQDLPGFITHCRANPGKVSFGSAGVGTTTHLGGALFALKAGVQLQHVPYRGSALAMNDLVAGTINAMFDLLPSSINQIQGGLIRALATTGSERAATLPEVPTVAEAALPGFRATSWYALMAPAGTPAEIITTISRATVAALGEAAVKERIAAAGAVAWPTDAAGLARILRDDSERWAEVVREARITLDNN